MTERGQDIPYSYETTATSYQVRARFCGIADGEEPGHTERLAGRLMLRRVQGKLAFGTLQDGGGRIQLFAPGKVTPDFARFCELNLGDWIGVEGEVMKTRKGELSIKVDDWTVLAPARRPFPDKWHGISDPDTRYSQRFVDLWVTPEARAVFILRSRVLSLTRRWLEDRGFIEVETPIFHPIPGGALAKPFTTHHNALDQDLFLRIAPELYLKRLTVAGLERVFEIGRVFRNEGMSTRHNPEFTMLELYQAYADYDDIMELVEQLVSWLATQLHGTTTLDYGDRKVELAVRNTGDNEDEDGPPTNRGGKTNYFIFPGDTGADAAWLMGADFESKVVVSFEVDGVTYTSDEFLLRPHTHGAGDHDHGHDDHADDHHEGHE